MDGEAARRKRRKFEQATASSDSSSRKQQEDNLRENTPFANLEDGAVKGSSFSSSSNPDSLTTTWSYSLSSHRQQNVSFSETEHFPTTFPKPVSTTPKRATVTVTMGLHSMQCEGVNFNVTAMEHFGFSKEELTAYWGSLGEVILFHPRTMSSLFSMLLRHAPQEFVEFNFSGCIFRKMFRVSNDSGVRVRDNVTIRCLQQSATLAIRYMKPHFGNWTTIRIEIQDVSGDTEVQVNLSSLRSAWRSSLASFQNFFRWKADLSRVDSEHQETPKLHFEEEENQSIAPEPEPAVVASHLSPFEALGLVRHCSPPDIARADQLDQDW